MRAVDGGGRRREQTNRHAFDGSYGDYLLGKVSKVFPDLGQYAL